MKEIYTYKNRKINIYLYIYIYGNKKNKLNKKTKNTKKHIYGAECAFFFIKRLRRRMRHFVNQKKTPSAPKVPFRKERINPRPLLI